jgi:hypothetical protein
VFAEPRPEVIAALRAEFPEGLYLLRGLRAGWREDAGQLPMPEQGLLVVRELCHPQSEVYPTVWFGDDGVSWLLPDDIYLDEPVLVPAHVSAGDDGRQAGREGFDYPPQSLLRFLSRLSAATDTVVSLYYAFYWGGDIEQAYSWVFERRRGVGKVYVHLSHCDTNQTDEVAVWDQSGPDHLPEIAVSGDVLTLTLDHHEVRLEGGWFAAHARDFDWDRYRIE